MKWKLGQGLFAVGAFCVAMFTGGEAEACHDVEICVVLEVDAVDNDTGNLGVISEVEAAGSRIRLVTPDAEGARDMYLNANGCFTAKTRHTRGLKLLVYPDSYVGVEGNVRISTFPTKTAELDDEMEPWLVHLPNVPLAGLDKPVSIGGPVANMHGWNLAIFKNVDQHAGLLGERSLRVHGDGGETFAHKKLGAFATKTHMMLGPLARERKFIIAHEFGHWYQQNWTDDTISTAYGYEDESSGDYDDPVQAKDPDCDFANAVDTTQINDLHGIRSAEFSAAAMAEGFAHFVAALAFNDVYMTAPPPQFEYYKDIIVENQPSYNDLVNEDDYQVDLIGSAASSGGAIRWTQDMCPADWNTPINDPDLLGRQISTEIDWLRMFWGFVADPDPSLAMSSSLPEFLTVMQIFEASGLGANNDIYLAFQVNLDDPAHAEIYPYRDRFADVAVKNGVQTND
ncbi:MAG: hypothetical protein ACRBN8_46930 [Nannocystales bacterium]